MILDLSVKAWMDAAKPPKLRQIRIRVLWLMVRTRAPPAPFGLKREYDIIIRVPRVCALLKFINFK